MAKQSSPAKKSRRRSLRDKLNSLLIRGLPPEEADEDQNSDGKDDGEFRLKPGWTIKV